MSDYLFKTRGAVEGTVAAIHARQHAMILSTDQGDTVTIHLPWTKYLPNPGDRIIAHWEIQTDRVGFTPVVKFTDWKPTGPREEWT